MSIVQDFLAQKDGDYAQFIPSGYNLSADDKARVLTVQNQRAKYEISAAGKCMKPCFTNFKSAAVSENESECMTNCIAKSLESLARAQLQFSRAQ